MLTGYLLYLAFFMFGGVFGYVTAALMFVTGRLDDAANTISPIKNAETEEY